MWQRSTQQLRRVAHTAVAQSGVASACSLVSRFVLPVAPAAAARAFHTCRSSGLRAAGKPPSSSSSSTSSSSSSSSFADLDDLFGEEQATAVQPGASRLTNTLRDTRVSTQASAAAHAAATSSESAADSLDESLSLLSAKNPPKLEPRHMQLLRVAASELERKLERAKAIELEVNPSVFPPSNPNIAHLTKRLTLCQSLVAALFPPEVANVPFDEEATADILDYAESMPGVLSVMTPDSVDPMKLMVIDHKTTRKNRHIYCLFCKPATARLEKNQLVYTNVNLLTQFVNERGMVLQRAESRLCHIHQRKVAKTIKQARNIGLLSPSSNWRVDPEFVYGAGSKDFNPHSTGAISHSSVRGFGLNQNQAAQQDRKTSSGGAASSSSGTRATSQLDEDLFGDR